MSIYFDNAATTQLAPELIELINELNQTLYANPSSLHSAGRAAKKQLSEARQTIADILNVKPEEIIFTSGATESNNFVFQKLNYDLIITSPTEHASVLEPAKVSGKEIVWLDLDEQGFVDIEALEQVLEQYSNKSILISLMHGNNEIGTIQNVEAIANLKTKYSNVLFHSDCVQTFARYRIDLAKTPIDFISASAHKIHGPKGVGFLYIRNKFHNINPLLVGGGQEFALRSGTENLISIIAFAHAAKLMQVNKKQKILSDYLFQELTKIDNLVINGPQDPEQRLIGNFNISLMGCRLNSEELVLQMDLHGIAVSSGSACSSNKGQSLLQSSYVLRACKIKEDITIRAIRISLSCFNSREEIDQLLKIIGKIVLQFPALVSKQVILG